ncbi:MAG: Hsp33 family molecular chaperone HslO [Acidobacteriota bacterium]
MSKEDLENAGGRLEFGIAGKGSLRWAAADITGILEEARRSMDLSPVSAAALGETLTAAALLLQFASKDPSRLVVDIRGAGPLRKLIAEVDDQGNLRAMVGEPRAEVAPSAPAPSPGTLAVGEALGQGFLRVLREVRGKSHESVVQLITGRLALDFAHYLEQSEQRRSAVVLGVLAKPTGIAAAGGMLVEYLPGRPTDALDIVESNLGQLGEASRILESGGLQGLVAEVLNGLEVQDLGGKPLRYKCRCDRERLRDQLSLLSQGDREHLRRDDGSTEAECAFCGTVYRFAAREIEN